MPSVDFDPAPRLPLSTVERALLSLFGVGFVGLIAADLARGFSTNKLAVVFVLVFWVPLLVLHELGHAAAARMVGWRVSEIVIGFGRELLRFRIGETRVSVRAMPVEGYVLPYATDGSHPRKKLAFIYLAGPLTQLAVLAVLAALWRFELPEPGGSVGDVALQSLALSAALGALCTLIPYVSGRNPSDGLGALSSWLRSDENLTERLAAPFASEARRLLLRERAALAADVVRAGLERHPSDVRLLGLSAVCRAASGDAPGAYAALEALGPPDVRPPGERAELLADAGWAVLFAGDSALLGDARRALESAHELIPEDPHYEILLGRVQLERGRPAEAYVHLMAAYKRTRDVDQEAQCVAYLAIACAELESTAGAPRMASYAERFAAAVEKHDVPPALRERVGDSQRSGEPRARG